MTLKSRKIIEETPGKTIYAGRTVNEVYHCFTDSLVCPRTSEPVILPGKGALTHRLNAFLFSRLKGLGVPTHFIQACNMRESLMMASYALPVILRLHCRSGPFLAQECGMQEGFVLDPPLLEYRGSSSRVHLNDEFLMALGWLDQDEIDDVRGLALRVAHILQGVFISFDIGLVSLDLTIARSMTEGFLVAGELGLEQLVLQDVRTAELWGWCTQCDKISADIEQLKKDYVALAQRLDLYHAVTYGAGDVVPFPVDTQ